MLPKDPPLAVVVTTPIIPITPHRDLTSQPTFTRLSQLPPNNSESPHHSTETPQPCIQPPAHRPLILPFPLLPAHLPTQHPRSISMVNTTSVSSPGTGGSWTSIGTRQCLLHLGRWSCCSSWCQVHDQNSRSRMTIVGGRGSVWVGHARVVEEDSVWVREGQRTGMEGSDGEYTRGREEVVMVGMRKWNMVLKRRRKRE